MDFPLGLMATHYYESMRGFPGFPNSQCISHLETKITGVHYRLQRGEEIQQEMVFMIFIVCIYKKEYSEEIMLSVLIF